MFPVMSTTSLSAMHSSNDARLIPTVSACDNSPSPSQAKMSKSDSVILHSLVVPGQKKFLTLGDIKKLCEAVERTPELWNRHHPRYQRNVKRSHWEKIHRELNEKDTVVETWIVFWGRLCHRYALSKRAKAPCSFASYISFLDSIEPSHVKAKVAQETQARPPVLPQPSLPEATQPSSYGLPNLPQPPNQNSYTILSSEQWNYLVTSMVKKMQPNIADSLLQLLTISEQTANSSFLQSQLKNNLISSPLQIELARIDQLLLSYHPDMLQGSGDLTHSAASLPISTSSLISCDQFAHCAGTVTGHEFVSVPYQCVCNLSELTTEQLAHSTTQHLTELPLISNPQLCFDQIQQLPVPEFTVEQLLKVLKYESSTTEPLLCAGLTKNPILFL